MCLCYVIGACEGAPLDHAFRAPAWSHVVSRVITRACLRNVGDRCVLRGLYNCVVAGSGGWYGSGSFVTG